MSKFVCETLAKHHDRKSFNCGVPELDDYLQRRAGQDMRRCIAAVFVLVPEVEPNRIAGYDKTKNRMFLPMKTIEQLRLANP